VKDKNPAVKRGYEGEKRERLPRPEGPRSYTGRRRGVRRLREGCDQGSRVAIT